MESVACIILYDDQKNVLLQHRSADTQRMPNFWAFFGGQVEKEETPKQAAIREVYEETRFKSKGPRFLMKHKFEMLGKVMMKNVFVEYCPEKSNLELHEGQGWGWYNLEDTKKLKITFHDREVLDKVKKEFERLEKTEEKR